MASTSSGGIYLKLALFLLTTAFLSVSALYFDLRNKNSKLKNEAKSLRESQILLMVPDEQSDALSEWLKSHPESIDSLLEQKKRNDMNNQDVVQPKPTSSEKKIERTKVQASVTDFGSKDIKTYKLPHGGIRVTTRQE
ncbi:hypothetical protein JQC92_18035 [Shewanella sp. 202IG2-18]|uniref:hypothetical protein n=1 Tax=Parashewanella hymeniacidonis TaxID=2807618 RepID=UPI00195F544E|nr:hypothetical protein [Parashewanella hymeniacidonis]MBM7073909.1 hypothetical protein [Parashewanella hymeniacidonis]